MSSQVVAIRCPRKWTFSLKALLFLTSIVAVCSALIGVSAVLALLCLPFIAAALVRTMRIHGGAAVGELKHGLFVTFCQSLLIVVSLISVSAIAFMVACCAGALIVLGVAIRLCRPVAAIMRVGASRLAQSMFELWQRLGSPAFHEKMVNIFYAVRSFTVLATISLVSACRILLRQWWHPESGRSAVTN